VAPAQVLDRGNAAAYRAAVYLLRRAANMPLASVAKRAGVSPPRVSQIQAEIERKKPDRKLKSLIERYKIKA
jgi:putative transposase